MKPRTLKLIQGLRSYRRFTPVTSLLRGGSYRLGKAQAYRHLRIRLGSRELRRRMKRLGGSKL